MNNACYICQQCEVKVKFFLQYLRRQIQKQKM